MEYELEINPKGRIDITGLEKICKGDILNINGQKQKVIDIHEGSVFTQMNGEEIEYGMVFDNNTKKNYMEIIN